MPKGSLERVKKLAQQLSPEDRNQLFYFLADLPDSGIQSHSLEPPSVALDNAKESEATTSDGDSFVIVSTERAARLMLKGRIIFDVFYYPENFQQSRMEVRSWKDAPLPENVKEEIKSILTLHGVSEVTEEYIIET